VGNHPERIKNLYFYYAVLVRAVSVASNIIKHYNYTTGDHNSDKNTINLINQIAEISTGKCA